ncbi:hypothetical protein JTB14_025780 [Gonioctena quinquepunctata]|nr:hypothetical protein JTB14_025780 [Gonioctena quinquepunctata]
MQMISHQEEGLEGYQPPSERPNIFPTAGCREERTGDLQNTLAKLEYSWTLSLEDVAGNQVQIAVRRDSLSSKQSDGILPHQKNNRLAEGTHSQSEHLERHEPTWETIFEGHTSLFFLRSAESTTETQLKTDFWKKTSTSVALSTEVINLAELSDPGNINQRR